MLYFQYVRYFFFIYSKQTRMKNNCLQVAVALLCPTVAMSVSAAPSGDGTMPKNRTVRPRAGNVGFRQGIFQKAVFRHFFAIKG